jgi:hypothetical protein
VAGLTKEIEAVQEDLLELTGAKFEVSSVVDEFRSRSLRPKWFLKCTDMNEARRIPHVNEVWKQEDGTAWLESLPLGDTIDWIEVAYGEEEAARSIDVNYSDFDTKAFQARFGAKYPLVFQRIQRYEEVARSVSKARRVHLELRKNGSKGIVVFAFAARIAEVDLKSLAKKMETNIEALKDAYGQAMQV